ncbi:uncharacterized protein N7477_001016 [Penicillium maclennaniae]|uniref:uncharacterized protein n=1 Tax=Penicillium maclennaniae TaxID=1343394 RepID=UPI0025409483|nr:uncharacterized protein N7477_001016 [Penicillium maclennaniae]KAJ5684671.1 hypothetical protein N7477_001016 [Penicillium maclennaniae]
MGGIPWQSKGCKTCKTRKIKVHDTIFPERLGHIEGGATSVCTMHQAWSFMSGYEHDRTFIHHDHGKVLARSRARNAQTQSHTANSIQSVLVPQAVDAPPTDRAQLFSSFLSAYFPLYTAGIAGADVWYHLITGLSTIPNKGPVLDKALSSLTCVGLGQINQDQRMLYQGTRLYNATVRHMSDMIERRLPNEELLFATVIFQRLEPLLSPHGIEPWLAHAQGTNMFLRECYHNSSNNPFIAFVHQHQQVLGVADPLSSPNTSGDGQQPPAQSNRDRPIGGVFELFTAFKPILRGIKQLDASNHEACQTLLQDLVLHKDKTIAWFAGVVSSLGAEPTRISNYLSTCAKLPLTDEVFGPAYYFPSLGSARLHVVYWTALALVYTMMCQVKVRAKAHSQSSGSMDLTTDEDTMLSWVYADEVCRGIPHCLTDTENIWGAQHAMFPLAQVANIYSILRWREKFMWCQQALSAIESLGFGLAVPLREAALKHWALLETANATPSSTCLFER